MFKSQVSFTLCSFALMIAMPSSANPGHASLEPSKRRPSIHRSAHTKLAASSKTRTASSKTKTASSRARAASPKNKIGMSESDKQQGMKFVRGYIRNNDDVLHLVRRRSEIPFTIIDSILTRYKLPLELKYLAVIESELKPTALSPVGAKGPWQLMPTTAHVFGLKVNKEVDERKDFYKSTRAAAKYLKDLHRIFSDWLLVLAAYNGGPTPVYRAIHKAHSRDFWVLQKYLPRESRLHVKKFIATAYYFERIGSRTLITASVPVPVPPRPIPAVASRPLQETENEKFARLMMQSAESLKASNEAL